MSQPTKEQIEQAREQYAELLATCPDDETRDLTAEWLAWYDCNPSPTTDEITEHHTIAVETWVKLALR